MLKDFSNITFGNLPDNSRVWVYQSNRALKDDEVTAIQSAIDTFVVEWTSHSRDVIADGKVLFNRFIVLVADETAFSVSGCSIDSSVHFVKALQRQYNIEFFDRMSIAYMDNEKVKVVSKKAFKKLVLFGKATRKTIVFNNTVTTKAALDTDWIVPGSKSWHGKVFSL